MVDPLLYLPQFGAILESQTGPLWQQVLVGDPSPSDFAATWADALTQAQRVDRKGK
ncbi:hypothetical protein [Kineococcus arenarius]|uniref:hypothetical protein n=1 Tax=Kineococcus sp. SYSU DK007 TaxID=3383128 RepID=UPI003D7E8A45